MNPENENPDWSRAGRFFRRKDSVVQWALVSHVASIVTVAVVLFLHFSREDTYLVVDPSGQVYRVKGTRFSESRSLHLQQAVIASTALLSRHADGFELPDVVRMLFAGAAQEQIATLRGQEDADFQARAMLQHPQIAKVEINPTSDGRVLAVVEGQVLRFGKLKDVPSTQRIPFQLQLRFSRNPVLLTGVPSVITDLKLTYDPKP